MTHLDTNTWEYGPVDKGINRMHYSIGISVCGSDATALDFLDLGSVVDYWKTMRFSSYEKLNL